MPNLTNNVQHSKRTYKYLKNYHFDKIEINENDKISDEEVDSLSEQEMEWEVNDEEDDLEPIKEIIELLLDGKLTKRFLSMLVVSILK